MRRFVKRLWRGEDGAAMVEYGLLVGLIAVVALSAVTLLGTNVTNIFNTIANAVGGAT
jgi:pilus assembly protein Flp/PilA